MSVKNDSLSITGAFMVLGPGGGGGARDAQKGGLEKRTFSAHRIIAPPPTSFLQKITVRTD